MEQSLDKPLTQEQLDKEVYIKELELSVLDLQMKELQVNFMRIKSQYEELLERKKVATESAPSTN